MTQGKAGDRIAGTSTRLFVLFLAMVIAGFVIPSPGSGASRPQAAAEPDLDAEAGRVVDASGCLVSPPFVDPHFHMDATLSYGIPRINASGTLLEGIALWGELKPLLTHEAVKERAIW